MLIKFANKLKKLHKGSESIQKKVLINNMVLFLTAREKVLNNFKNILFSQKMLNRN